MLLHYRQSEIICIDLLCSIHTTIDFDLVDSRSCRYSLFFLVSWLSENKQKIQTRALISEYKQTIEIIRLDQRSANTLLIQICKKFFEFNEHSNEVSHRTAWSLYLEKQTSVSLLQRHRQCNDLLIILSISESICLSVHVQLVSLLQWHLFSMQWSTHSHHSTHQWIWSYIHMQLVSLLQWRAQSRSFQWASWSVSLLQWHCQCNDLSSHRSTHQWIDSFTHSCATSESATMTSFVNAMIYLFTSLYLSVNRFVYQFTCN